MRNHLDRHFRQIEDIDLSGYSTDGGWEPIGTSTNPFTGTFDGNEKTISGLVIDRSGTDYVGLFGCTGAEAKIRDLGLANVNVTGSNYVGGLVGRNYGLVTNSYATDDVTGRSEVGGLVGQNDGSITDSYFTGTVTDTWSGVIGGLIGENNGTITNCHAEATVTSNESYVGGLVGENCGSISESYAVGDVEGKYAVGGLVGYNSSSGNIDKSYATGTVRGTETGIYYTYVGGLVGSNIGSISDSYARGAVSGQEDVGGLVGYNSNAITKSYATGAVGGDSDIGGLAGFNHSDGIITTSYWDTETSLQSSSDGGTGKTTAEMKQQATFTGWGFDTIWGINDSDNNGYPFLRWQGYEHGQTNTPPVVSATGASSITQTGATLNFTSDKAGTYYYLVYAAAEAAPDAAAIKAQGVASAKGTGIAAAAANAAQVTGLAASTAYKAYVIVEDAEENVSNVAVVDFTTATAMVPTYVLTITAGTGGSITTGNSGNYAAGTAINIAATPSSGYSFSNWSSVGGGTFGSTTSAGTTFTMPANAVTITAGFTYNGSGGGNGGGGGGHTPPGTLIDAETGGNAGSSGAAVIVEPNVLPSDARFNVTRLSDSVADDIVPEGLLVSLGSDIYEITTSGTRDFGDQTITIRIAYDPAKIAASERPVIRYMDKTPGQWIDLPTTVEQGADGKLYAVTHVNHLTKFAVFSTPALETTKKVIVLTLGQLPATVDGQPYTLDAAPFVDVKAGRTLVPVRFVSEALGAGVNWNGKDRTITIRDGDTTIVLTLDSKNTLVDGQVTAIDCAPVVLPPGRTFVPLRFVGEALGAVVEYEGTTGSIAVTR